MTPSCRLVQGTSPAPSSVLGIAGQWPRSFLGSRVPFAAMPLLELAPPGVLSCARCSCDFGASGGGCHCGRVWPCGYGRACGAGCGAMLGLLLLDQDHGRLLVGITGLRKEACHRQFLGRPEV